MEPVAGPALDEPATDTAAAIATPGSAVGPAGKPPGHRSPLPRRSSEPLERVLFVGDSTSWSLSLGVTEAMLEHDGVDVRAFPAVGCGIGGATPIRYLNLPRRTERELRRVVRTAARGDRRFDPDVVVVVGGVADLSDREVPGVGWSHIGEPDFDEWMTGRMTSCRRPAQRRRRRVGMGHPPPPVRPAEPGLHGRAAVRRERPGPGRALQRADRSHSRERDDRGRSLDFAGFLAARPGGEFAPGLRPDGVHIDSRRLPRRGGRSSSMRRVPRRPTPTSDRSPTVAAGRTSGVGAITLRVAP